LATNDDNQIDSAVVAELYLLYSHELRLFLTGVTRSPQLADDLVQATFVILREKGGGVARESLKSWLFQVAFREALAVRRREQIGERVQEQVGRYEISNRPNESIDEQFIRGETVEAVRNAIERLSPEQQQVVRLRVYEELKFTEIAERLCQPLGTVLGRMRSAQARLREELRREKHE
jgi:RNA polymerase sigma-70 factor (ECF subfamily)